MRVKICGITNMEDARLAVELGADALGFIFYAKSPRHITPAAAREIIEALPPFVTPVAVVVARPSATEVARPSATEVARPSATEVSESAAVVNGLLARTGCRVAQVHGGDAPGYLEQLTYPAIKAVAMASETDLAALRGCAGARAFLLDAKVEGMHGGTGHTIDWTLARQAAQFGKPIILAGGLTPENVAEAIHIAHPYAVDLNSGVESVPGKKDPERLRTAFAAIRGSG